jgi:hypothetical protein
VQIATRLDVPEPLVSCRATAFLSSSWSKSSVSRQDVLMPDVLVQICTVCGEESVSFSSILQVFSSDAATASPLFETLIHPTKITEAMPIFREDHHFFDRGELL